MMLGMVRVDDLSASEQRVWDNFPTGKLVDFGTGNAEDDHPAGGEDWGPDRQVRAEVLAALLCGAVEVEPGQVGGIYLQRARITGELELPGATFMYRMRLNECCVPDGFDLSDATLRGMDLRGCDIGAMRLPYAKIDGVFDLRGAHLDGKGERALSAVGLTVTGDMFCHGLQAEGEIFLNDASIGSQLDFTGAHLDGKGERALTVQGITVTGDMFCRGLQAEGMIHLNDASIGRQLTFIGAHLDGKGERALTAQGITVTGDMFCHGLQAEGMIHLNDASIGRQLSFTGAHLDGKGGRALSAQGLTVTGEMFCTEGFRADGEIYLVRASIQTLVDERNSWPRRLRLDGLTYDNLTYMPARERLDWLNRSAVYWPQPYEQLAGYYRRLGQDDQARRVLLSKQRQQRRQRPRWARWWGWLQDALVGYGYAPGRALLLLAGAFIVGWLVFRGHPPAPVNPAVHPSFNAALYTLDLVIPAPGLGQASAWNPHGVELALAVGLRLLGWLLAITVIAAITRSFSRT
jgi:hypothetical protein